VAITERDIDLPGGRTVHVYDSGDGGDTSTPTIYWHHGSPQVGVPPEPLVAAARGRKVRWLSHDRPGYGGSSPQQGRSVASVAADVAYIADTVGVDRFAVMGQSGGGPHALACAGMLGDRVLGAVCIAGLAPFDATGLDWFSAMGDAGAEEFRAAARGREALQAYYAAGAAPDDSMFAPADMVAFSGAYGPWLASSVERAMDGGFDAYLDDFEAFVSPWGFDFEIAIPVLFVHGAQDRFAPSDHSLWLARQCQRSQLWLTPDDGHISIFDHGERAVDWLIDQVGDGPVG